MGNLLSLAWPMVVGSSFDMLGPTIDMIWVGKLGSAPIAGVGVAGMVVFMVNSMVMGLYMGLRAMVARFIGAGESEEANHVAQQAIVVTVAFSSFLALVGVFFAEPILVLLGVGPDVVRQGTPYLRINLIGMITMSFRRMTESIMQASGDSVTPMTIAILYRIFHIALAPMLIFGWWVFPRMGVTGAAITSVISQGLGAALGLWFLVSGRTRIRLDLKLSRIDFAVVWRLIRISLPAAINNMERTFGQLVLMWFMTPFGTLAVASHTLNQRVEVFLLAPAMGVGQSAGVLAGQNLGAKQPGRAEKTGWMGTGFLAGIICLLALAIYIWAEHVVRIFNTEPELVAMSSKFLRIAIIGFVFMGSASVLQQSINCAGDTLIPMLVSLLNMWLVQVPLAYLLPHFMGLGVLGVRYAMVFGTATSSIIYLIYFWSGRWKRKKI